MIMELELMLIRKKAFKLYKKAADLGHLCGMNNLGYFYKEGIGTEINLQKAFGLYQKSAYLGSLGE
ncbi:hypothetical protein C1645_179520 [Glomus cerebriforme]|uniref:Sel1 repeat protein n=1 Tax=Glomus cerebriforme TaxID=658196 RepID=A0A397SV99_9GLOM|nr:hypothetical protein C1645_179520 [Glomus cerebriforme]